MKNFTLHKIIPVLFAFTASVSFAQGPPPPNGCDIFYALDPENDGFSEFVLADLFAYVAVDAMNDHGWDISGYNLTLYPSQIDYDQQTNPILSETYTNIQPFEQSVYVSFTYSGSGPQLSEANLYTMACWNLMTVYSDGDDDFDTVPNSAEDLNGNGSLNDDNTDGDVLFNFQDPDDDNDGLLTLEEDYNGNVNPTDDDTNGNEIPDYLESGVTLGLINHEPTDFTISPNPSTGNILVSFSGPAPDKLFMFDLNGRLVRVIPIFADSVNITNLDSGVYLVKVASQDIKAVKKLIVK